MPQSIGTPVDELERALTVTLHDALGTVPQLVSEPSQLAEHLALALSRALARAAEKSGTSTLTLARALSKPADAGSAAAPAEERVVTALGRHPSGRSPGVTPDSLASLTGLAPSVLGPAVSALVQAGRLVRDAWLVRLPHAAADLLPSHSFVSEQPSEPGHAVERRAIGDRRALGERRLYDRRALR
ncbi:MAG TPA: hypothetical protein VFM14_08430 [Gemmatimonadales bacterium]|nr:hypothetical protein [Gemmatimonadales bacterium]